MLPRDHPQQSKGLSRHWKNRGGSDENLPLTALVVRVTLLDRVDHSFLFSRKEARVVESGIAALLPANSCLLKKFLAHCTQTVECSDRGLQHSSLFIVSMKCVRVEAYGSIFASP